MRRPASFRPGRRRHALASTVLLCAVALAACGRDTPSSSPRTPSSVAPATGPAVAPAAPPAAAHPSTGSAPPAAQPGETAALETWDAAGIRVERLSGDAIRVQGTDRWGARIDTTYADATYFANAVPVFSRGLRDDQARAMTALIPRVRAATGAPAAPTPPAPTAAPSAP